MDIQARYFTVVVSGVLTLAATAQELDRKWWFVNGTVQSMARAGDTLFVGGVFDHICPPYTYGAVADTSLGYIISNGAHPDGSVFASCPDGAGGWFIGGAFDNVGDQPRHSVARVNPDGSLHPWAPEVDYTVQCMVVRGDTLYIGGAFNTINGQARSRIAAFSVSSGALLQAVACTNMTGAVSSMSIGNGILYFGGSFTSVCGQPRSRLAAIDIAGHAITTWAPTANGDYNSQVDVVSVVGPRVYVGGGFDTINAVPRSYLAALDTTGALLPWAPMVGGSVRCLLPFGDDLFIGGWLDSLGGEARDGIGLVDTTLGAVLPWQPAWSLVSSGASVLTVEVDGDKLYLGGNFELSTGARNVAAIDRSSGAVLPWSQNTDDQVRTISISGERIYCGGWFRSIGRLRRQNGAAFSISTRQPLAWDPRTEPEFADLWALAVHGDVVYLGGSFQAAGGGPAAYLAGVDRITGDLEHAGGASGWVNALEVHDDHVFAGGSFSSIAGGISPYFAQLTPQLDSVAPWDLTPNSTVAAMHFLGDTLFLGGWFNELGGEPRSSLAAIDLVNNVLLPWSPPVDDVVRDIRHRNGVLYVGGDFNMVDNTPRSYLAAVDFPGGALTPWAPVLNDQVSSIDLYEDHLFATGSFYHGSFVDRINFLAGFRLSDAERIAWDPDFGDMYWGIESLLADSLLFVGGNFFNHDHTPRQGLVVYDLSGVHTAVQDRSGPMRLAVWPNPANDVLHVAVPREGALVRITDTSGRAVLEVRSAGGNVRVDITMLAPGPYSVHTWTASGRSLSSLFVKQ